jgi:hypothetical protein
LPNRSYQKGYRFERKAQAWLVHLGHCARSMMSRGADLTLTFNLREWSVSCKCTAAGKLRYKTIKEELEKQDICMTGEDRDPYPMVHMYAPKFVEILGKAEAADFEAFENQYLPNGTEGG